MVKIYLSNQTLLARKIVVFLFIEENKCYGYSSEVHFWWVPTTYMYVFFEKYIYILFLARSMKYLSQDKYKCNLSLGEWDRLDKSSMVIPQPWSVCLQHILRLLKNHVSYGLEISYVLNGLHMKNSGVTESYFSSPSYLQLFRFYKINK